MSGSRFNFAGAASLALFGFAVPAAAQSGGFVMTLGRDTVQVEQFARAGNVITGSVATRAPRASVRHYTITVDEAGRMTRYEQSVTDANGVPATTDGSKAVLDIAGDSIVRESLAKGAMVTTRVATPGGAFPLSTIPLNTSMLVFEFALQAPRRRSLDEKPTLNRLQTFVQVMKPTQTPILYTAPDSIEVDYFGQGKIGFKFDESGRLIRSDWLGTTYKVLVTRVDRADAGNAARLWASREAAGNGFGRLSTTDTVEGKVGAATVSIAYGRPLRRGRVIWGDVVPWNVVWRLGADFATHLRTDADLVIGETTLPAGTYTLWMLPATGQSQLIASGLVNVWGTQYAPGKDIVRLPMERTRLPEPVERLTVSVRDGRLVVAWGDAEYSVHVSEHTTPNTLRAPHWTGGERRATIPARPTSTVTCGSASISTGSRYSSPPAG